LLDLVFQVFGDKEVLDAYDDAKRHQHDTEVELQRFETELEGVGQSGRFAPEGRELPSV
jgi:hypothetical protein